jgi:hypothetical protein
MSRIDLDPQFDYPNNPEVLRRYVKDLLACLGLGLFFSVIFVSAVIYSEAIDKFFTWLLKNLL